MSTTSVRRKATHASSDEAAATKATKATTKATTEDGDGQATPQTGAPNPYALASLVGGRRINWGDVPDGPAVLEEIFDQPYTDLIGSADSPIFYGTTFEGGKPSRRRPEPAPVTEGNDNDVTDERDPDVSGAKTLADLVAALGTERLADIPVRGATLTRDGVLAELGRSGNDASPFARLFDERIIDILFPFEPGYHPPGFSWQDTGRFYNEATEFFDPVQGQVGDCYFISAMSSVAWAMPFTIADRTRATGTVQDAFTHQVSFFDGSWRSVEVSDRVLVASGGSTSYYAHSAEAGEIWPAVYEKAYAKWRFGTNDDFPKIPDLAWGDPVAACRSLTGGNSYYNWHSGMTDAQLLSLVKSHSAGGRTTTPMVAWTHGAGSDEAKRAAIDAGIVASHAYSVLGWMRRYEWVPRWHLDLEIPRLIPKWTPPGPGPVIAGAAAAVDDLARLRIDLPDEFFHRYELRAVDYVIARNPWGSTPGTGSSTASGDYRAYDVSWWRDVQLGVNGVFAMEVSAFRRYFAGTGGAA